ncbi:uncharacterized protein LOC119722653 [Patiria miniata]|uniref:JmjC domain-containing protein n=1 Tax=Patiria miniata TaxID=46514 RepID=A0A913ZAM3_PATMI|nr:uncharacterized protein LOC119722653 [Patiria miniata]XP_038048811.1 uncharacterized protein LOC119722653 [Patiria miniata]XP_038048812.1 uncharacterized protein LOC119722653 [Patiria miniata]
MMLRVPVSVVCHLMFILPVVFCDETGRHSSSDTNNLDIFYDPAAKAPLGSHREPSDFLEELSEVPGPVEFNQRYVSQYRPVVFRGAGQQSKAYHLWTEEYLTEKYGNLTVRLEARHESNSRIPAGVGGLGRDTIAHFLEHYQTSDGYIISQIPSPMEPDIAFPPCLTCGSFSRSIQEVHVFLSAKGGKTVLHRDPYSSVHCVFNGTKQWIVIDPKQKASLYISEESTYEFGGYSTIDVDNVDLDEFPKLRDVEYARVILNKGDCIYMPSGYMHQVRSNGYMNAAVSIWFSHYYEFDAEGCHDDHGPADFRPMNEVDVLWRYNGTGNLSQGMMDIHMLRTVMLTVADKEGKLWIEDFVTNFIHGETNEPEYYKTLQDSFRSALDPTNRGYITVEELNNFSISQLKDLVWSFQLLDPSDTDLFEYSHIQAYDVKMLYEDLLHQSQDGSFSRSEFIEAYVEDLGGTSVVANEILDQFGSGLDTITAEMVDRMADASLSKFQKVPEFDPFLEHLWYKHLVKEGIIQKFKVVHDEL